MSITARIELANAKPVYTSGDHLKGTVTLVLKKEASVEQVVLKHKTEVSTKLHVEVPKNRGRKNEYKEQLMTDSDKVHHKEVVLFPPKELLKQTSGKGFTLPAGTHNYDFNIVIPGHIGDGYLALPPSMVDKDHRGKVEHELKVTVRRTSAFKMNTRVERPLTFAPSADISWLNVQNLTALKQAVNFSGAGKKGFFGLSSSTYSTNALVEVQFPPVIAQAPHKIPLRASVNVVGSNPPIMVTYLHFSLVSLTSFSAKGYTQQTKEVTTIVRTDMSQVGKNMDLSGTLGNRIINKYLTPTFNSRLISTQWTIQVKVGLADPKQQSTQEVAFEDIVTVLPPSFYTPDHQQADVEQISQTQDQPVMNQRHTFDTVSSNPSGMSVPTSSGSTSTQPSTAERSDRHPFQGALMAGEYPAEKNSQPPPYTAQ